MQRTAAQTGAMGKSGNLELRDVLHSSALLTNEMVMLSAVRFEPNGVAFYRYLANQSDRRQGVRALVDGGQRSARIGPVDGLINFFRGGVHRIAIQLLENRISLRRAADSPLAKGGENFLF
jgi:hypothetical protein